MPDYRTMYDSDYLGAWNLVNGKGEQTDATVTILRVEAKEIGSPKSASEERQKAKRDRCPVLYFDGKDLGFVVNKTNGKTIAGMYGTKTEAWIGKQITLYPTTTKFGRDIVDCIRVRPTVPAKGSK